MASKAREMLSEKDVRERAKRAGSLARRDPPAVTEFLLAVLAAEPSMDVRISIVESLGDAPTPRLRQALSDLAASDANAYVSLSALERLRFLGVREERDLLQQRLDLARRAHDDAGFERLVRFAFPLFALAIILAAVPAPTSGADPEPSTDRLNKEIDNVKFTDNTVLDAEAVKFNIERIKDPNTPPPSPNRSSANQIQSETVVLPVVQV